MRAKLTRIGEIIVVVFGLFLAGLLYESVGTAESPRAKCEKEWTAYNTENPRKTVDIEDTCKGLSTEDTATADDKSKADKADDTTKDAKSTDDKATDKAAAPSTSSTTVPTEDVKETNDNTVVAKDTNAVTRIVNDEAKQITITGGKLKEEFKTDRNGKPEKKTAWTGYATEASARKAACKEADSAKNNASFKGYKVNVDPACDGTVGTSTNNSTSTTSSTTSTTVLADLGSEPITGKRLTGDCGNTRFTDGQIRSVDNGATAPKGALVVLRQVDNAAGIEYIEAGCVISEHGITAGKQGLIALDLWTGYSSVLKARSDACGQAVGDLKGSKVQGAWNNLYDVQFMDGVDKFGKTPATCPAR